MLSQFSQAELDMFRKDFMCIIHMCRKLNDNEWRVEQGIRYNIDVLNSHIAKFSAKYRTLQIVLEINHYYEVKPVILLKDESDFFNVFSTAAKIAGSMESVEMFVDGKYKTLQPAIFEKDFEKLKPYMKKGSIYFNITSAHNIQRKLHLKFSEKYGMIELIIDRLDFTESDPEFKLCAYYALSFGYGNEELEDIDSLFIGPVNTEDQQYRGAVGNLGGGSL
jgi:hypothetical protein